MSETGSLMRQFRRYPAVDLAAYRRFMVAETHVGWVVPDFAVALARFPHVFHVDAETVTLQPRLDTFEARSEAVAEVLATKKKLVEGQGLLLVVIQVVC